MRHRPKRVAVIATTYNRPDALAACLWAFARQSDGDFDLVVADDGSGDATRAAIAAVSARSGRPVKHVWQEDRGFRAAAARNRAVASTDADYLIFVDGDCVPLPGFVGSHRRLAEPGFFLSGNRVLLSPAGTARLLQEGSDVGRWRLTDWLVARRRGEINRLLPLLRLPDGAWRRARPNQWQGIKSCNLSVWRDDFLAIDGFDESFEGWGLEDSDFVLRLQRAGLRHKTARFGAPLLHLWHPPSDRKRFALNSQRLAEAAATHRIRALRGYAAGARPSNS